MAFVVLFLLAGKLRVMNMHSIRFV